MPSDVFVQKIDTTYQPQLKVHTIFAQLGLKQGVTQREQSSSFANRGTNAGAVADLSTDLDGIGDLAVPCSHERPAKDRPVDL
jgi:hypothetical protein